MQAELLALPPPAGRVAKNRDDARMYGTEREHITRTPEDPFFKKYAAEASR
jgi:protein transport protein SEC24